MHGSRNRFPSPGPAQPGCTAITDHEAYRSSTMEKGGATLKNPEYDLFLLIRKAQRGSLSDEEKNHNTVRCLVSS